MDHVFIFFLADFSDHGRLYRMVSYKDSRSISHNPARTMQTAPEHSHASTHNTTSTTRTRAHSRTHTRTQWCSYVHTRAVNSPLRDALCIVLKILICQIGNTSNIRCRRRCQAWLNSCTEFSIQSSHRFWSCEITISRLADKFVRTLEKRPPSRPSARPSRRYFGNESRTVRLWKENLRG